MKEFILLPKHTYNSIKLQPTSINEKRSQDVNRTHTKGKNKNRWGTTVPPPTQPIPLRQITVPEKRNNGGDDNRSYNVNTHTTVNDRLTFHFQSMKLGKAQILLKHFKNNLNYKWDHEGDIHSPNNNRNILDIIHDFLNEKKTLPTTDLDYYKYVVYSSNIPLSLIKNKSLKKSLEMEKYNTPNRVGGKLLNKKVKQYKHHTNWNSY